MAANASGTGYTCTPSSTGYYAHVRSTSKGWVVHETHGTYTQRVVGYKSAYTYADTGHRVSSISNWSVTATDYAGVAGAIKAGSASSGCGPY
ncbi:hypothetical protein [Cellulomonas algicola]|uniref:hypothetical protein n=1 Tax=Cellulomonas algicola TaxID=2071633 RepID=UPI001C3FA443|nr:hypothetical protein [Cellulomonas algicola]